MTSIEFLASQKPNWFEVLEVTDRSLSGIASISEAAWKTNDLCLMISGEREIRVQELTPGRVLPSCCFERHIEEDYKFCLGFSVVEVVDGSTADEWWEQLHQFIRLQSYAAKTGTWPKESELDHGKAAIHRLKAEALAAELGLVQEYADARNGKKSWITNNPDEIVGPDGTLLNRRRNCPRGCVYSRKRSRGIIRKDCKRIEELCLLIHHERERRAELNKFWDSVRDAGISCCQTMSNCPLNSN